MATLDTSALEKVRPLLLRTEADPRQVVVMMCGIAGSGKSTLSKAIAAAYPQYTRLSIDGIQAEQHGICGRDYPRALYETYQDEADAELVRRYHALVAAGARDIILDRSFYAREDRDEYRRVAEAGGARCVLVCFRPASRAQLWERVERRRRAGRDADSALEISEALLGRYWDGFEWPEGEGEVMVDVV